MEYKEMKQQKLKWLLDNIDSIEILGIHADDYGMPILLIEFNNWDQVKESNFTELDGCILIE